MLVSYRKPSSAPRALPTYRDMHFRLTATIVDALVERADSTGKSFSEIVREALDHYLSNEHSEVNVRA